MTSLKRVASLQAGGTPSVDDPGMWCDTIGDGVPWVSIGDMSDGKPVATTSRRVSQSGIVSKRLPIADPGTLLFAMYASVGAVGRLAIRASWNQALLGISPRPGLSDSRFIGYWLEHLRPTLAGLTRSNTQDNLNAEQVGNFPFPNLGAAEQRAIADYLDAETARIDALIAKKRQLIRLLEERWKAKLAETAACGTRVQVRHVTSARTSGPRGWADRIGEFGRPFVRSANLTQNSIDLKLADLALVEAPVSAEALRSQIRTGDSLIGITGANTGWVAWADQSVDLGVVSQHVAILRPSGIDGRWLTYSLAAPQAREQLLGGQYGGTKTQLGLDELAELIIGVPSKAEQTQKVQLLDEQYRSSRACIEKVHRQLGLLAEHRQALITAAVTGEFSVPGAA